MDSQPTPWKVLEDEEFQTPAVSIRFIVDRDPYGERGGLYRSSAFGMDDSYLIRVSVFFVVICFICCYYYFAHVRRRPVPEPVEKAEPEPEDPAKLAEAKIYAALAARSRQVAFEKSGAEEEAKQLAAELAAKKAAEFSKPWPRHRGKKDDNPLQWSAGTATRRGFT